MGALKLFLVVHEEPALVNQALPKEPPMYVPRPSHLPLCSGPPSLSVAYVLFVLGLIGLILVREEKKIKRLKPFFFFFFFSSFSFIPYGVVVDLLQILLSITCSLKMLYVLVCERVFCLVRMIICLIRIQKPSCYKFNALMKDGWGPPPAKSSLINLRSSANQTKKKKNYSRDRLLTG